MVDHFKTIVNRLQLYRLIDAEAPETRDDNRRVQNSA